MIEKFCPIGLLASWPMRQSAEIKPNNIRVCRIRRGVAAAELARSLDVARNTLWRWETGKGPIPQDKAELLAEILEVSPAFLMGWRPTPEEWAELGHSPILDSDNGERAA